MWTMGQRIHLGGCHHAYFVTEINSETNDIIVVSKKLFSLKSLTYIIESS